MRHPGMSGQILTWAGIPHGEPHPEGKNVTYYNTFGVAPYSQKLTVNSKKSMNNVINYGYNSEIGKVE